jgi:molybdopterin synthase sulfur carrier subunit
MRVECNLYGPVEKTLGQRHVTVEVAGDATVGDVLDVLVERAPDLEEVLFSDDGTIADSLGVIVNHRNVSRSRGLETPVDDGDEVLITPPIAGG